MKVKCNICRTNSDKIFNAQILNKYEISYFRCNNCGFMQTENPYWLEESYKKSINVSDTGLVSRNICLSKLTAIIIYFFLDRKASFLDYAGGYGLFTRLMRDIGFDFYWHDPITQNILAKTFEFKFDRSIEALTCFETFEHFDKPIEEIERLTNLSKNIIFSTQFLPNETPQPNEWWYYGLEHGQHISFYSIKTLQFIAKKMNLYFYSNNRIHLFTEKKINDRVLQVLLKTHRFGMSSLVANKMTSKTFSDMQQINKSLQRK